jgi:hypothetical protein
VAVELRRWLLSATVHELDNKRHRHDPDVLAQLRSSYSTAGRRRRRRTTAAALGLGFWWRHKSTGWRELELGILGVRRGLNSPGGRPRRAGQGNRVCQRRTRAAAPQTRPSPVRGRLRGGDDRRAPPVSRCGASERGSGLAAAFWADWAARLLGCYVRKVGSRLAGQ